MIRKVAIAAAVLAALVGLSACDSGWGPGYCYGEGGQQVTCVSPGSPGTGG